MILLALLIAALLGWIDISAWWIVGAIIIEPFMWMGIVYCFDYTGDGPYE